VKTGSWFMIMFVVGCVGIAAQEDVLRPNGRPGDASSSSGRSKKGKGLTWRLGLEAGINYSMASRDITGLIETSPLLAFSTGSGISPLFGIYAEVELTPSIAIGTRVLYDMKSFGNTKSDATLDCIILDEYGVVVNASTANLNAEYTQTVNYVTINPLIRWSVADRFFVHLGPVLQFATSDIETKIVQTMDDGEICRFNFGTPDSSTTFTSTGTDPADPSFRVGLDLGLGYRIPLTKTIDLVPRVGYQFMFTPYGKEETGIDASNAIMSPPERTYTATAPTLHSLQASLSLWFSL